MELPALIQALSAPAAYPFAVERVDVLQTHISVVFLAGEFAYKVKKPVDFGFLDFSTLDKRRHFCNEEVRLNRRLAPDVYLDVVPVTTDGPKLHLEGAGAAVEWAVKMRRLPEETTFQARILCDQLTVELAEELGRRVASFHRAVAATPPPASFGRFASVARNLREIYTQSLAQVGLTVNPGVFERARALNEAALARHRPLIDERAERGTTRDTHGDLHLDHVYYFPEKTPPHDLAIIDCIEFTERFRYTDPVADMAFPYMDFLFYGRRDLAAAFADAYFEAAADAVGRSLLTLYTGYRASIRGSVEGLKLAGSEITEADRITDLRRARAHWLLALVELEEACRRPCLILVGGLQGTGKSTLARELSRVGGLEWVRADVVRKELAGVPVDQPTPETLRRELYSPEWNDRTYTECLHRAGALLFEGKRVLIDATFREESRRQTFLRAAVDWGVPAVLLIVQAAPEKVQQRLAARTGDASDADWSVYLQAAAQWEKPSAITRRAWQVIVNDGTPAEGVAATVAELRQWNPALV